MIEVALVIAVAVGCAAFAGLVGLCVCLVIADEISHRAEMRQIRDEHRGWQ